MPDLQSSTWAPLNKSYTEVSLVFYSSSHRVIKTAEWLQNMVRHNIMYFIFISLQISNLYIILVFIFFVISNTVAEKAHQTILNLTNIPDGSPPSSFRDCKPDSDYVAHKITNRLIQIGTF